MESQQTLFIPEHIHVELMDKNNEPLHHENILIGIQTYANHKNDVDISPFLSDKNGCIDIPKGQILENAFNFINYGIMDYISIEYARPRVKFYYWGNDSIENYLNWNTRFLLGPQISSIIFENIARDTEDFFKEKDTSSRDERKEYLIFRNCHNRTMGIKDNITLAEDIWDKPQSEIFYKVKIPV